MLSGADRTAPPKGRRRGNEVKSNPMMLYWLLLAGLLVVVFSALKKRLRRQIRELNRQPTRFDEFTEETLQLRKQTDREAESASRKSGLT